MIKHANIKGVVYDVIDSFEYEQNQILKLQRQEDKKIFYFKVKSADEEIIGQVIEDEKVISKLDKMDFFNNPINDKAYNTENINEFYDVDSNYSDVFDTPRDNVDECEEKEQPRNKETNETIANYFKYLVYFFDL